MKIKGWSKILDSSERVEYQKIPEGNWGVSVHSTNMLYRIVWEITKFGAYPGRYKIGDFETKEIALKKAVAYMRRNP